MGWISKGLPPSQRSVPARVTGFDRMHRKLAALPTLSKVFVGCINFKTAIPHLSATRMVVPRTVPNRVCATGEQADTFKHPTVICKVLYLH